MVKIEIRCRIPIWRTFGQIPWHVIPEPPATLQGAATWQIQCHDPRAICHIVGLCHRVNSTACHPHTHVSHCRVLPLGEFNVMIPEPCVTLQGEFNSMPSHSHASHCRVLPLGEFTVMIPERHATLRGAVTWRSQCHDRATLQGVIITSTILKIVFAIFCFFKCSLGYDEWQLSYRLQYTCY